MNTSTGAFTLATNVASSAGLVVSGSGSVTVSGDTGTSVALSNSGGATFIALNPTAAAVDRITAAINFGAGATTNTLSITNNSTGALSGVTGAITFTSTGVGNTNININVNSTGTTTITAGAATTFTTLPRSGSPGDHGGRLRREGAINLGTATDTLISLKRAASLLPTTTPTPRSRSRSSSPSTVKN